VESLTFILMFAAAWLVWRRPERERLAFRLLVASILLMIFLFSLGTHTSLLPGVNY
jgi:heme A synthase